MGGRICALSGSLQLQKIEVRVLLPIAEEKGQVNIVEPSGHFRLYIYNSLIAAHMTAGIHPPDLIAPLSVQGKRAALPSATIMIRQPIQRFSQMQASDIDIYRNEIRKTNAHLVHSPRCRSRLPRCLSPWLSS